MLRALAVLFCIFGALVEIGCGQSQSTPADSISDPTELGHLPLLRQSADSRLHDELNRIEQEGGTPEQLTRTDLAKSDDLAIVFGKLFSKELLEEIDQRSRALLPLRSLMLEAGRLERAARFRATYRREQLGARAALARRECAFAIPYTSGMLADLDFVDAIGIYGRLEAIAAAEHLSDGRTAEATEAVRHMLRAARLLAEARHAVTRIEAAFLRAEALSAVEGISQHPRATRTTYARLFAMLDAELAAWPGDAETWFGDRALGLHTYELFRSGDGILLLSDDEFDELSAEGSLTDLLSVDPRKIDTDELYYLETMRELIRRAREPYYRRLEFFEQWRRALVGTRGQDEYPLVAARILLGDIERAQAILAADRAAMEAWSIALALAAGRPRPAYHVNPLTGQPYRVTQGENHVSVWGVGEASGEEDRGAVIWWDELSQSRIPSATRSADAKRNLPGDRRR